MIQILNITVCITWIILGLFGELGDTLFRGKCQNEGYFRFVLDNSRLKHYVISTHDVLSLEDCVAECLSDARCSSCNFQVSGVPLHKCELNTKSRSSARPGSLIRENGFQYYEIDDSNETESLCRTVGCKNGGSCVENCETLSYPHYVCKCPSHFTGVLCEIRKTGNFLLNYNTSTIDHHTFVSVTGVNFYYLAVHVWVKPRSRNGVVFSYATTSNPREIALLFNETNVVLYLAGHVIPFNFTIAVNEWSQICFIFYARTKLIIYHDGLVKNTFTIPKPTSEASTSQNTTEPPHKVILGGVGTLVPGFDQISPGTVNRNSGSNLTLTRLYVIDRTMLAYYEILRLFNEPSFSVVTRKFRVDWRYFYQPPTDDRVSAIVVPSSEPDIGDFDVRFPGDLNLTINSLSVPPLETYALSTWIRVNMSHYATHSSIFELASNTGTVLKMTRSAMPKNIDFFVKCSNSTIKLTFENVITDENWFHLIFKWSKLQSNAVLYKDGSHKSSRPDRRLNITMPAIHNGTIRIGDDGFVGDITSLNLWSVWLTPDLMALLAFNPGNAAGDLFSWKSLRAQKYSGEFTEVRPSDCHKRPGGFDLIFPQRSQDTVNYVLMRSSWIKNFNALTVAFWIKVTSSPEEFTLISYAVPEQLNEFNVHFGTAGIWVYIHGEQRFIPLQRSKILNEWHHFIIFYSHRFCKLFCYHNGHVIARLAAPGGSVIAEGAVLVVGAQPSGYGEVNETAFQFSGELSQLQVYRRSFPHGTIHMFSQRCSNIPGNLFRWTKMQAGIRGDVRMRQHSDCLKIKHGEVGWY